jgi:hypothetical protein
MSHRTPIEDLKLQGSPNLNRALKRKPKQAAKRAELEAMFTDITDRRKAALADVKTNGTILFQDKFSARGALYQIKVVNPSLKIAQQCEKQLAQLAKQLNAMAEATDEGSEATADAQEFLATLGRKAN